MINRLIINSMILLFMSATARSGEYHGQGEEICSDCHTTHYSERGSLPERAEPGGPFPELLVIGSVDRLCLACHDGTDPAAPDVLAPVAMYNGSGSEFSGGGYFTASEGFYSPIAHDLGLAGQTPYSSPGRSMSLSCISCHDPHGTGNYRNLLLNPDSLGADIGLALGSDIFENTHPQIPPERNASVLAYRSGNTGYKANISRWCLDCHNGLSSDPPSNQPAHFLRHPWDVSLDGPGYHSSPAHWTGGTGDGFGVATGDGLEGVPRLRFQAPSSSDYNSATQPGSTNQIVCVTCHFAHGPHQFGLTWPYETNNAADLYSGCQQCHNK